jgi:hypothetical protein
MNNFFTVFNHGLVQYELNSSNEITTKTRQVYVLALR